MYTISSPHALILLVTAATAAAILLYLARRRESPGAEAFFALMVAVIIWTVGYTFQLGSAAWEIQLFWHKIQHFGVVSVPLAWLLFAVQYTGRGQMLTRRTLVLLFIEPAVILALIWTNDLHGLYWASIEQLTQQAFSYPVFSYGVAFWANLFYSYLLLAVSAIIILRSLAQSDKQFRLRVSGLLIGLVAPVLANLLSISGLNPFPYLNLTPFGFFITVTIIVWSIIRFRFLEILPHTYQTIISEMDDGVLILDTRGRVIFLNPAAGNIISRPVDEITNQSIQQILTPQTQPAFLDLISHLQAQQSGASQEFQASTAEICQGEKGDLRYLKIKISPTQDASGLTTGYLVTWHDITASKNAHEALREQNQQLQLIINQMPAVFWSTDANLRVTASSGKGLSMMELEPGQVVGTTISEFFQSDDPEDTIIAAHNKALKGDANTFEAEFGGLFFQAHLEPLIDFAGEISGTIGIALDITERQRAEQALRRQLAELSVLHAVANTCAEASDEDTLIERVTQIISRSLYTDNFGILLLDDSAQMLRIHPSYLGIQDDVKDTPIKLGKGVTGITAATGEPQLIPDVAKAPDYRLLHPPTRSELSVPIQSGGRVLGVINAESEQPDAFSQNDERLLSTLAGQLATAIERVRVEAAERKRVQELLAITSISQKISSVLDYQEVFTAIVRHATEISNADASGLFMRREDERLYLAAKYGVGEAFEKAINELGIPLDGSVVGRSIRERQPIQVANIREDANWATGRLGEIEDIYAVLALPMLRGEDVIGGIVIWQRHPRHFTQQEVTFLQALASQSVNAVENARLFEGERQGRQISEALRKTGTALGATLDYESVLDRLLEQLEQLVPYKAANILLVEGQMARSTRSRGYAAFGKSFESSLEALCLEIKSTANLRQMSETRQPLVITDTREYPGWFQVNKNPSPDDPPQPVSWIGTPIIAQDRVIAFLSLDHTSPNFYRPEHAEQLMLFASQVGLALQNAKLFKETQRRLSEVTLLSKVIALTTTAGDMISALTQICTEIANFYHTEQAVFMSINPREAQATIIAQCQRTDQLNAVGITLPFNPHHPSSAHLLRDKTPLIINDTLGDPLLQDIRGFFEQFEIVSALVIPLLEGDQVTTALSIGMRERHEFDQADVAMMQNIASQVSQALERLNLFTATRSRAAGIEELARLSEDLNRPLTEEEVIRGIGESALTLGKADRAALYIRSSESNAYCAWYQELSANYVTQVTEMLGKVPGGQLLQDNRPVLISDTNNLPEDSLIRALAQEEAFRCIHLWPLIFEEVVIAAVGLYYNTPHECSEAESEILQAFTRQAAVALQNARLFEETRRRAIQQETINQIIAAGINALEIPDLLETVLGLTLHAIGLQKGGLWVSGHHVLSDLPEEIGASSAKVGQKAQNKAPETLVINDWLEIDQEDPLGAWKTMMERYQVRATLMVPVLSSGRRIGALSLASAHARNWLAEEITFIETIGRQLGGAAERLNLLAKTQEQARQMQQIMDTVPEGVILLDANQEILMANPAAKQYLAMLLNTNELPTKIAHLGEQHIEELLQTSPDKAWHEMQTTGALRHIFEVAARPLGTAAPQSGWVLVLRDVTLERENQARIQMQDRLATVGQLAAGIAHDFNNILAAIVVYSDLLNMDTNLTNISRERIHIIQQQTERASSLIRQILDFSRRSVMEQIDLDLLPFVKELDKLLERILPETIQLELTYHPGSFLVKADPTRLQQVFMNLALNARDAMRAGGILHFELERYTLYPYEEPGLPDLYPGDWVRVMVSDSGQGIPEDILPHVFDPFFTTKPVGQGTGLGLAQVYGIVKQHSGCIDVISEMGKGTTFTIYLPALEAQQENSIPSHPRVTLMGKGQTVLVVEDDRAAREALHTLLESRNYTVLIATNGLEALDLYKKEGQTIALVVSDVMMPEMGGVDLYHHLKKIAPKIKILFITGHPMDIENQILLEAGRVQWLQKPFSVQEFSTMVHTLLAGSE